MYRCLHRSMRTFRSILDISGLAAIFIFEGASDKIRTNSIFKMDICSKMCGRKGSRKKRKEGLNVTCKS